MPAPLIMGRPERTVLKFVVVGGSLAGLATAYALRKEGHHVMLLERNDGKTRSRGGIRSPPNMTRILQDWGFRRVLNKVGVPCTEYDFFEGETGSALGLVRMHEDLVSELMADFLFLQHGDLHTILFNAALQAGVDIHYNAKVTHVNASRPSVTLETGETHLADVIIGADGHNSVVRSAVVDPETIIERLDRHLALIAVVPVEDMRDDEDLRSLTESNMWTLWLGNDYFAHGSLMHGRREYNINIFIPRRGKAPQFGEHWNTECSIDEVGINFVQLEPRMQKLLKIAEHVVPTSHIIREPFENYVSDQSTVCLVGEAAHPMMPNGSHNASMSIEDAATLGRLFARIQHKDQIPRIVGAFEELRQSRCTYTQEYEWRKREFFTLPRGAAQELRDAGLREAMQRETDEWDGIDEEYLKWRYERELELFAHDACEVVEDWWTKWGALLDRQAAVAGPLRSPVEVSISRNGRVHA
ncbi:hypothetical protein HGRIS_014061 [Hohenbuehelia grisea]|uniref:FAD-binding domain-containing protein n=1 Tax=Hohenbuehelia grisea TaxID=104357 RepID=A0ABR3JT22_9AGAR